MLLELHFTKSTISIFSYTKALFYLYRALFSNLKNEQQAEKQELYVLDRHYEDSMRPEGPFHFSLLSKLKDPSTAA